MKKIYLMGRTGGHVLFVCLAGILVYFNTFDAPFQWDENFFLKNNPFVKNISHYLDPVGAREIMLFEAVKTRPVGYFTFALNYWFHGFDEWGYHVFNLAIHILNGLMLYFLVISTFQTPKLSKSALKDCARHIALLAGIVFVVHPVQTEAVTYIFQRFASLMTFFYLLSLLTYLGWRLRVEGKGMFGRLGIALYAGSLLSAVLAMKTKENAFTLPFVVLMYEFFFFNGGRFLVKTRLIRLVPLLLTLVIVPLTVFGFSSGPVDWFAEVGVMGGQQEISRWDYFLTQYRVLLTYIRLLLLPTSQNINYDYPVFSSLFEPQVFLSFLFFVTFLSLAVYLTHYSRYKAPTLRLVAFGIFWFTIALSVESTIVPLPMVINEYRLYLPSVGSFMAIAVGVVRLLKSLKYQKAMWVITVCALPALLGTATYFRNAVWGCEVKLWKDTAQKSPQSAMAHNNLALAYQSRGLIDDAISNFRIAISLQPENVGIHNNLALAYRSMGLLDKAMKHYQMALMLKPDVEITHNNMGVIYFDQGNIDKAIEHYRIAVNINPTFTAGHNNLGIAYQYKGMTDKAVEHFETALEISPDYTKTHYNLGLLYLEEGFMDSAHQMLKRALEIDPDYHSARQVLDDIQNGTVRMVED